MFVHPFNDIEVMAGQGTIALEMFEDAPDLEILPVPIGGGRADLGVATAAKAIKPDVRIIGFEPAMYPSFTARMRGINTQGGGQTIAEGIAVKQVGDLTYAIARPLIDEVLLVEEPEFERAIALYANVEKTIAEGAGAGFARRAAGLSRAFQGQDLRPDPHRRQHRHAPLASVMTRELVRAQRIVSLRIIGDDRPGLLATVSQTIGAHGANIIEVAHNRLALDVPAKGAEFDVMIETRDAQHTQEIIDALRAAGYPPRAV